MQLNLSFSETTESVQHVWENLDEKQRQSVIEKLTRLIAATALETELKEEDTDD